MKRALWLLIGLIATISLTTLFYFIQFSDQTDYYQQKEHNFQIEAHNIEALLELHNYDQSSLNGSQLEFLKEYLIHLSKYQLTISTKDKLLILLMINQKRQVGYTLGLDIFFDSLRQTEKNITLYQELIRLKLNPIIIDKNVMFLPLWITFHQNGWHFILIIFVILICQSIFLGKEDDYSLRLEYYQPIKRSQFYGAKVIVCLSISILLYISSFVTLLLLSDGGLYFLYQDYPYLFDGSNVSLNMIQLFMLITSSNLLLIISAVVTCGLIAYVTYNKSLSSLVTLIIVSTIYLTNNRFLFNTDQTIIFIILIMLIVINMLIGLLVVKKAELP
ncbi:MAG: ABC transporter permease subunit [Erysipelotrichaceae bacterium]|nr:ABC transporter permease subunit [Erysipelotrichaceae bacterium]